MKNTSRRHFLKSSAVAGAALTVPAFWKTSAAPNEKVRMACMGLRGRGGGLMYSFAELPDVEVVVACDVDTRVFERRVKGVEERQGKRPRTETDFRRILDDRSIDALVVGTPDHWHAIPTIMACQAGKHVYVEKPAGHNFREGQVMLAAARKHKRVVQVGIQSRSGQHFEEACDYIRSGALGKVMFAKGWETNFQEPIGNPPDGSVPPGVDYDMWLGPAPKRAFNPARFHSRWRWFFDYGTGDLGNDGVHRLDYARRGLEAALAAQGRNLAEWPAAVAASGGKFYFTDAQEWPDTLTVTWDYPGAILMYEMRIWSRSQFEGLREGAAIYGEEGYVIIGNGEWRAHDSKGKVIASGSGTSLDDNLRHKRDFLKCIKEGGTPTCDIAVGHVASGLVHMGNIAWRVNRKLHFDSQKQEFVGDQEANRYLSRTYRAPWALPKV